MAILDFDIPTPQELADRVQVQELDFCDVISDRDYRASNQWQHDAADLYVGYDIGFADPAIILTELEESATDEAA